MSHEVRPYIRPNLDPDAWYPTQEAKRVRLTDVLARAGTVIELIWMTVHMTRLNWSGACWNAAAAASMLLIPVINRRRSLHLVARLALITLVNFWIFVFTALYLGRNGTQYCFLPMTSVPFVVLDTRNRLSTTYGVLLPLTLFIVLELSGFRIFPEALLLTPTRLAYWMTVGTAFIMSFLAVYSYRRANEKFEHELRESQGRFVRIVEAAQEGIVVCNELGRVSYINPALAQRLGVPQHKVVGRSVMDFISPHCRDKLSENVLNLRRSEVEFIRPDGKRLTTWMSTSPLYEDRPGSRAHIGLVLDITETRDKEKLIEQQRGQILSNARLSALGEMAAGIAHEIYNPLTSIRLAAAMLLRFFSGGGGDQETAARLARQMEVTIERIVRIIEGLKAFSGEDRAVEPTDVSLASVIEDTLSLCRERFRVNAIELVAPSVPPELAIRARPIQISQVLLNLLNNAFHAVLTRSDRRVSIDYSIRPDQMVEVSVTDNGPGIAAAIHDRIFQPFFTTKPPGVGTGLGLSISKGIIESNGGQLSFHSVPGRTTFSFTAPLSKEARKTGDAA